MVDVSVLGLFAVAMTNRLIVMNDGSISAAIPSVPPRLFSHQVMCRIMLALTK